MAKSVKITLMIAGGCIGLLALLAVALFLFVDPEAYRTRLETAASEALGLEVQVAGRLDFNLFPRPQLSLTEVRFTNQETRAEVGTIKELRLGIGLLPLLDRQIDIRTLTLIRPRILIERDHAGNLNLAGKGKAVGSWPGLDDSRVSLTEGVFQFTDRQSGASFEALECSLKGGQLRAPAGEPAEFLQALDFTADVVCGEIRTKQFTVSNLRFSAAGKPGVIVFEPIEMQVFGARGSGSLHVNFSGSNPIYEVRYALPRFLSEEFFKTLSLQKFAEGPMEFSANLTMQGRTLKEIKSSTAGKILLQGENLKIHGRDLDQEFDRFESSQNFNLVDVGAIFIAGPFGLLVTKGYNFASILQGPGGESEIRHLMSDWQVDHGMARARDVALATREHRVALQGELDFVNETFNDVTVALIDAEGCAKVRQSIRGRFQNPVVEQPGIFKSLSGPIRKLVEMGRDFFPGGECEKFYDGSVALPK